MSSSAPIVCKPTSWFLLRAVVMLVMFAGFAGWFFHDWKWGYREKNLHFYLYKTFEVAGAKAQDQSKAGMGAGWSDYVDSQVVQLPDNRDLVPEGTPEKMPWPEELKDFERLEKGQWNQIWLDYTAKRKLAGKPSEHAYDEGKMREQLIALMVCGVLALVSAFFLIRTLGRKMVADGDALVAQDGRRVPYKEFTRLDKRKWATKGLAYAYFKKKGGAEQVVRIDGMTYGGFRSEDNAPAEQLMKRLEENFSGEVVDYEEVAETEGSAKAEPQS